jgi:mannose-1-phosphate guanylyltransferase
MVNDATIRRRPTTRKRVPHGLWPVVLAAGAGRRLAAVTGGAPKQFWRPPTGAHTLLEETLSRVATLATRSQVSVIVDETHHQYVSDVPRPWRDARWVFQPRDCGTAAGVLLALTPVLDRAPDAMVLITPSDHGILDTELFRQSMLEAGAAVSRGVAEIVLFGIQPHTMCPDYGWILPGAQCDGSGTSMRRVIGFREKPAASDVPDLLARHALWSTMVLVTRASTLWRLYQTHLPSLAALFSEYLAHTPGTRAGFLNLAYASLESSDFSRDLLAHARGLAVHAWPASIGWADLGTPERLQDWMRQEARPGSHNAA